MSTQTSIFNTRPVGTLTAELAEFSHSGTPTQIEQKNSTQYFVNEFWTARQRQAHRIHEISYRACFKPQLPAFFIERLSAPGEIVYDPFMGRGTTPIEAALHGRIPYGNDTNPLSRVFAEPRINPPNLYEIRKILSQIPWSEFRQLENNQLLEFFHPTVLAHIEGLRNWLLSREKTNTLTQIDRWIRMVAANRLTGHSAGFFSVYTLPPNQAVTVGRQKKINQKRNQIPPLRDVAAIIEKKSKSLLSHGPATAADSLFLTGQSDHTPAIADESVTLTVTSPPFLDIVDYKTDNWLRCWFIGIDSASVAVSHHRNIEKWQAFIGSTLRELVRITRPGGHIAFEVGETRKAMICLEDHVIAAAQGLPLETLGVMINQQDFSKTANCWGIANNTAGTNSNRIAIFRKI